MILPPAMPGWQASFPCAGKPDHVQGRFKGPEPRSDTRAARHESGKLAGAVMQEAMVKLVWANLLLQILDGVASYQILSAGVPEFNPLVSYYIENWGLMGGLFYGKLVGCALVWLIFLLRKRVGPIVVQGLIFVACFYSLLGILLMVKMVSLYV